MTTPRRIRAAALLVLALALAGAVFLPPQAQAGPPLQAAPTPNGPVALDVTVATGARGNIATLTWRNLVSPSQWVWLGLFFPEDSDATPLVRLPITCAQTTTNTVFSLYSGTCSSRIPYNSGRFEFRLLREVRQGVSSRLARTAVVAIGEDAVTQLGPRVAVDRARAAAGSTIAVSWSGISTASAGDQLSLVSSGGETVASLYVGCGSGPTVPASTGSCSLPITDSQEPGEYNVQLIGASGDVLATSGALQVLSSKPGLTAVPNSITAGQSVVLSWTKMPEPQSQDWLGLFPRGAGDREFLNWVYVSCTRNTGDARSSGDCVFSVPPDVATGTYELRYISALGNFHDWAVANLSVTGLPATPTPLRTPTPQGGPPTATPLRA